MASASVYLVEDDDAVRASMKALLSLSGWEVTTFASGAAFASELAHLPPACVILDMRMPGMDGLAVLEMMSSQGADWPVVVMTGHPDPELAAAVTQRGAVAFLEKPCREQELFAALERSAAVLELGSAM